ncbi:hypothetical protein [Methanocalculus chunghsingensis]|nr:hypothetical protein [Methanocalculus chunghsingensis]
MFQGKYQPQYWILLLIRKRATLKRVDECEEEMSLPVANSPRSGQCGYEG